MNTQNITVSNIKCGGCANSIKKKLEQLQGVYEVNVDVEQGEVSWSEEESDTLETVKQKLTAMGYPEGDPTLMQTAKSFVSCAIGRMDKE